jgi:hypothetical protein
MTVDPVVSDSLQWLGTTVRQCSRDHHWIESPGRYRLSYCGHPRRWLNPAVQERYTDGSTLTDTTNYTATSGYPRVGGSAAPAPISASLAQPRPAIPRRSGPPLSRPWIGNHSLIAAVGNGNVDSNHQTWINDLIVGLKADGVWTKFDRLWLYAVQNTTCAVVDIKRWPRLR